MRPEKGAISNGTKIKVQSKELELTGQSHGQPLRNASWAVCRQIRTDVV